MGKATLSIDIMPAYAMYKPYNFKFVLGMKRHHVNPRIDMVKFSYILHICRGGHLKFIDPNFFTQNFMT